MCGSRLVTTWIAGLKTSGLAENVRSGGWLVPGALESLYLRIYFVIGEEFFLIVLAILN